MVEKIVVLNPPLLLYLTVKINFKKLFITPRRFKTKNPELTLGIYYLKPDRFV